MYGRNSFELLKAEVLFDELFHDKFNAYVFPAFPGAGGSINDGILDAALTPKLIRPTTFAEISGNTSERAKQFSKILKHSHIPYQQGKRYAYVAALPWSSHDDSALFSLIQADYGLKSRQDFADALKNVSMRNKFHPVRELLDSLTWDGKEHIRSLLPEYLGAEDSDYTYQVMRLWMLGAVSRVYKPGSKFDYTIILQGSQGIGKSTFLKLMALDDLCSCSGSLDTDFSSETVYRGTASADGRTDET